MGPRAGPSGYMGAAAAPQLTMATGAALQRLAAGHAVPLRPRAPAGSVMPAFRVHIGAAVDAAAVPIPQRTAAERAVLQHVLPGAHLVAATAMQGKPGAGTLVCKFWLHAAGPHAVQAATAAQSLIAHRFISAPVPGLEQPVTVRVWQHTDAPPHATRLIFKQARNSVNIMACRSGFTAALLSCYGYKAAPGAVGTSPARDSTTVTVLEEYLSDHSEDYQKLGSVGGDAGRVVAWVVPPAGDPALSRLPESFTTASGHVGYILRPASSSAREDNNGALRLAPARPGSLEQAMQAGTNAPLSPPAPGVAGAGASLPRVSAENAANLPACVSLEGSGQALVSPAVPLGSSATPGDQQTSGDMAVDRQAATPRPATCTSAAHLLPDTLGPASSSAREDNNGALRLAPARPGSLEQAMQAGTNAPLSPPAPGVAGAGASLPRVSAENAANLPACVSLEGSGQALASSAVLTGVTMTPGDQQTPSIAGAPPATGHGTARGAADTAPPFLPLPPRLPTAPHIPPRSTSKRGASGASPAARPAKTAAVTEHRPMDADCSQQADHASQPGQGQVLEDTDMPPAANVEPAQRGQQTARGVAAPQGPPAAGLISLLDLLPPHLHIGLVSNIRALWADGEFEEFGDISLQQLAAAIEHVLTQRRRWAAHKHVPDDGATVPKQVIRALASHFNATRGRVRPRLRAYGSPRGSSRASSSRSDNRSRSRSHSPCRRAGRADASTNWRQRSSAPDQQPTTAAPRQPKQRLTGAAR